MKPDLTVAELAYAAGFVDGEGCIGIYKCKPRKDGVRTTSLRLQVVNTKPEALYWLETRFGGKVYPMHNGRMENYPTYSDSWQWTTSGPNADEVITALFPYLITKRNQAVWAMLYQAARVQNRRLDTIGRPLGEISPLMRDIQEQCSSKIKYLNRRGRANTQPAEGVAA